VGSPTGGGPQCCRCSILHLPIVAAYAQLNDPDDPVACHEDGDTSRGALDQQATFPRRSRHADGSRWDGRLQMRYRQEKVLDDGG
jgi:hypothetical protein